MNSLLAIAESMLIDRILSNHVPFTGKHKTGLGLFALAGFLLALAIGFFIYAAYLWLASNYAPETAAALAGVLILGTSLLSALGAYLLLRYKRFRMRKFKHEIMDTLHLALDLVETELGQSVKDNPKTAVLTASVAGFIAGDRFL